MPGPSLTREGCWQWHLPTAQSRSQAERMHVRQAMRPVPTAVSPDLTIAMVLQQMKDSALDAWPIADAGGLLAMVRSNDLEQAVDDGASNQKVAEILREDRETGPSTGS